jgi:Family of unknown function (DUF5397)
MQGFEEAQSDFLVFEGAGYAGQVRRFGPHGPAYEVLSVRGDGDLEIEVVQSGERARYALIDFLSDPTALTVP